jgi:hypothetical protein
MATPVIRINSVSGSDTNESGAGPGDGITAGTALTGTSASYSGSVVTLDGSPDLSAVATDGSHVLYLVTSTGRKFFTINAVDDGADTVTTDDAPAGTATGLTWGIGGTRASLISTSTKVLYNSGGDADSGWIIEMASGHTDRSSARNNVYISGLTIRGEASAAVRPKITQTVTGDNELVHLRATGQRYESFDLEADTVTNSQCIEFPSGTNAVVHDLRTSGVNGGSFATLCTNFYGGSLTNCRILSCIDGIFLATNAWINAVIAGNYFECEQQAINMPANATTGMRVIGNVFNGGTTALQFDNTGTDNSAAMSVITHNTFYNQSAHALSVLSTTAFALTGMNISNNLFASSAGYGILFGNTAAELDDAAITVHNNAFWNNTSGNMSKALTSAEKGTVNVTADPFTVAGSDFSLNNNTPGGAQCRATGTPPTINGIDTNISIGAMQLAASASGVRNPLQGPLG